ncbi:MAG: hypothetical protein NTV42_03085 [Chloroflexi bacterium]|nr:hypothetical protein [Chloroflexota bacterium]
MLKHKSLVMVSVLVLVLAVVAMSCAPAKPATPPAPPAPPVVTPPVTPPVVTPPAATTPPPAAAIVEVKTSYESKKFTDAASGVSIAYPADWAVQVIDPASNKLPGTIFYAKGSGKDAVFVAVRPATAFTDAANQYLADLIAASGASFAPAVDKESTITLADGAKAQQIELSAAFGMAKAVTTGFIKNGKAIIVCGNSDPSAKSMALYREIGTTLLVK